MSCALQIRHRIEGILEYMQPYWEFVNCHMVNYLTDKSWDNYVPIELRGEIGNVGNVRDCINSIFFQNSGTKIIEGQFKGFVNFLKQSEKQRLDNFPEILTSMNDLRKLLGTQDNQLKLSIKEFMSEKKRHEVEVFADLINDMLKANAKEEMIVLDAGDGKGYLSSRLALQYGHKVLGIDYKESNTENAIERNKKLERCWKGLKERAELANRNITPPRRGKKQKDDTIFENIADKMENYKTTSLFIKPETDLELLIRKSFPFTSTSNPRFCLTGLHTCGNLASTCIQAFHAQPNCSMILNIGCCYHLLKEAYSKNEFFGSKIINDMQTEPGFPMSQFLKEKRLKLGRNARMLAAQSVERFYSTKELPNISLFYRALLEVLLVEKDAELKNTIQIGKVRKFNDFKEYVELCEKRLNIEINDDKTINEVETKYAVDKDYLNLFYLLRMSFAPVVETLILLDRLLYLKELNYEKSYLVSVFDAVISPRHYGIIALK